MGESRKAAPKVSDIYRVRTDLAGGSGASQLSTMFFSSAAGETAAAAATAVSKFWLDLAPAISNLYTMTVEHDVFTIDQVTGQPTGIESTSPAARAGTDAGSALPWATQGLISWTTGTFVGGRQVRGRTFIPGPTENANNIGVPTGSYPGYLSTAITNLLTTTGVTLVIYSRKNHSAWPVLSGTGWSKWAELRSRRD